MNRTLVPACLLLAALALPQGPARADTAARLVEEIGVTRQGSNFTVTVMFGCTVRYVSHMPADAGDVLHVRVIPGADCGSPATGWVIPPPVDDRGVIRRVTANRSLGNDVDLAIQWTSTEQYMLVPAFRGRGLRILLIRPDTPRGRVTVSEVPDAGVRYAVNLDASKEPFDAAAIAAASAATGFAAYVSETDVDGEHWYRLRAGPFLTQQDARDVLNAARRSYPKAWVAVADDSTTTAPGAAIAAGHAPKAGLAGFVAIETDAGARPELAIPRQAVLPDGLARVFFRRDPKDPDKVIRVDADLGLDDGRWVEVKSGLVDGDEVVVDGAYELVLASSGSAQKGGHFHADGTWHADDHK